MDERARAAVAQRVHPGEGAAVLDRREPRFDEVGPERQHDSGVLEGVVRDRVAREGQAVRGPDRLVRERLEGDPRAGAERLGERVHQRGQAPVLEPGDEGDGPAPARGAQRGEPVHEGLHGVVPRHGPAVLPRGHEPVGVIEALQRGLAPNAKRALVHRMIGIALELRHPAVVVLGEYAAPRRALPTDGREERGNAGHDLVVRYQRGEQLLRRRAAAGDGGGRARTRHDSEEFSPLHQLTPRFESTSGGASAAPPRHSPPSTGRDDSFTRSQWWHVTQSIGACRPAVAFSAR